MTNLSLEIDKYLHMTDAPNLLPETITHMIPSKSQWILKLTVILIIQLRNAEQTTFPTTKAC